MIAAPDTCTAAKARISAASRYNRTAADNNVSASTIFSTANASTATATNRLAPAFSRHRSTCDGDRRKVLCGGAGHVSTAYASGKSSTCSIHHTAIDLYDGISTTYAGKNATTGGGDVAAIDDDVATTR